VNRRWLCCLTQHELACMDQIVAQRFANSLRPSRADAVRLALVEQAANTQVPSLRRRLHAVVLEVQEHSSQHRPGAKRKDKRSRLPIVSSDPMVRWHQVYQREHFQAMRQIQKTYGFQSRAEAVRFALRATVAMLKGHADDAEPVDEK
jgi:hypothetical protein